VDRVLVFRGHSSLDCGGRPFCARLANARIYGNFR
jgi:hypothetical protein